MKKEGNKRRAWLAFVSIALFGFAVGGTGAAAAANNELSPKARHQLDGNADLTKVSGRLLAARRLARQGRSAAEIRRAVPRLRLRNGMVAVEVQLRDPEPDTKARLAAEGLAYVRSYPRYARVTGRIDLEQLDELAALAEVVAVRPLVPPRRRSGVVTSQGDVSIGAAAARSQFQVDGSGVKVGVISDSFNVLSIGGSETASTCAEAPAVSTARLTGSTPQALDELPALVEILDNCTNPSNCGVCSQQNPTQFCVRDEDCPDFATGEVCILQVIDEGRALAEIVHDLAPGAEILFHSGFNSEADFAEGVADLVACGADVVVDDLIYDREPMFQDGIIAQAVRTAVDGGAVYFSAAGNEGSFGVSQGYVDSNPAVEDDKPDDVRSENDLHDFGDENLYGAIRLNGGCGFTAVLQWNEPLGAASTDLDLLLCTGESPGSCIPLDPNDGDGQGCGVTTGPILDAIEVMSHFNVNFPGTYQNRYLAVDRYCSLLGGPLPEDVRFRIVVFGDNCSLADSEVKPDCSMTTKSYCFEPGIFDDFQIYGHAAAESAVAVAASFYKEIDTNGTLDPPTNQIDVEPFSSLGGNLPFYFDSGGSPLPGAPVTRFKPDITAPDGANTSFYGSDLPDDPDGFPNFVGTSAAAPHAAGVAALMLEERAGLTGSDISKILECTARDIEAAGPDALSGAGLVDAVAALGALSPQVSLAKSAALAGNAGDPNSLDAGDILTYSYAVTNPNSFPLESMLVSDPHSGLGEITCAAGNPIPMLAANGGSATCTATYGVTAGDVSTGSITNTATATGLACGAATVTGQAMDSLTLPTCILSRILPATEVTTTGVQETVCRTLDSGSDYVIRSGGSATFTAGRAITLQNGFTVEGTFTAAIDPDIDI